MHDQLLERRLRAALHHEADALPLTITAAELERRAAARRRTITGRRVTLLLAAAVATSLLAVVGGLSGVFRQTVVAPSATIAPTPVQTAPAQGPGATALPDLDDLVTIDPASILVAQSHGPADGSHRQPFEAPLPQPEVVLGTIEPNAEYVLSLGCLGAPQAQVDVSDGEGRGGPNGPTVPCDGGMHDTPVHVAQALQVGFVVYGQGSWRAVLRGPAAPTSTNQVGVIPPVEAGREQLVRWDDGVLDTGAPTLRSTGLLVQAVGAVATRPGYRFDVLCTAGSPVHLIIGDTAGAGIDARTETVVACDPTNPRSVDVGAAEPFGGQVFVAARPDQQVSLLVSAPTPPVSVAKAQPGWVLVQAVGPSLDFGTNGYSLSDAVGNRIQVALACTGTQPIVVSVDDSYPIGGGVHVQTFTAACAPGGTETRHTFTVRTTGFNVSYTAPAGIWSALSILAPG